MLQQSTVDQCLLIIENSLMQKPQWDSSVWLINLRQRHLPDNTQHLQQTSTPLTGFEPAIPVSEWLRTQSKWHLSTIHLPHKWNLHGVRPSKKESTGQKLFAPYTYSTTQLFCSTENATISTEPYISFDRYSNKRKMCMLTTPYGMQNYSKHVLKNNPYMVTKVSTKFVNAVIHRITIMTFHSL
jgi:hypothetical protein